MATFFTGFAVQLDCLLNSEKCRIFLPLESPLGTYEGQQYRPTGIWPAKFLCLRHARLTLRGEGDVDLDIAAGPLEHFYEIEVVCGEENCGRPYQFFSAGAPSSKDVLETILRNRRPIACDGHTLLWKEEKILVRKI